MNIRKRFRFTFIVVASLIFASLACNYSSRLSKLETPVPTDLPGVATVQVESSQAQSSQEIQATQASQPPENIQPTPTLISQESKQVKIVMTEQQMTSIVLEELQKQQDQPIDDPQILLRDGQVQVLGNVKQSGFSMPLKMAVSVSADAQGKPQYKVLSATVGPLPLPQSTLDQFSTQLDSALSENLGAEINSVYIEKISIADGLMTVTGHQR